MSINFKRIKFGVDLCEAAVIELSLLNKMDKVKCLYNPIFINEALRRYETIWLPLMKNYKGKIVAPIDIFWVWHAHMLCPTMYQKDLKSSFGKVINHVFLSENDYCKALESVKQIWTNRYPDESFDIVERNDQRQFVSNFSYDIELAAYRQASFFYQVSLPHYQNKQFLKRALVRYQKFLILKKKNPQLCIVPCYDIDIIWHTHQLNPITYLIDTEKILGYVLPHDDSVNDRSADSNLTKSDKITRSLWVTTFREPFSHAGSMYRGESTVGRFYDIELSYLYAMRPKLIDLKINFVTDVVRRFKYVLRVYLMTHNAKDRCVCSYDYYSKKEEYKYDTFTFSTHSNIGFRVKLYRKVGPCTKKLRFVTQLATYQDFDFFSPSTLGSKYPYKIEILLNKKVFDTIIVGFTPKSISICESFYGSLQAGEFQIVSIKINDPTLWGLIVPSKSEPQYLDGIMATHSIQNSSGKNVFDINVLHSLKTNQSIVQVHSHEQVLVIAHLIDKDQLPLTDQVDDVSTCPTLNIKECQRAMIIKDNKGDWIVLVANWKNAKTVGGYFEIDLFCLRENCRRVHLEIDKIESFLFIIDDLFVNLSTGQFELRSCDKLSDLPNYTCLIFAISILYILCKPRLLSTELDSKVNIEQLMATFNNLNITSDFKVTGKPVITNTLSSNSPKTIDVDGKAQLLMASGYNYDLYIPSNSLRKQLYDSGGCAGCVGYSDKVCPSENEKMSARCCIESSYEGCDCDFSSESENDGESVEWN